MIQSQTESRWIAHDENVIYGIGNSAETARQDAREWLDDHEDVAELLCVQASELLYHRVRNDGGDCVFVITRLPSNGFEPFAVTKEEAGE